jgi:serine O-acetyltransferase
MEAVMASSLSTLIKTLRMDADRYEAAWKSSAGFWATAAYRTLRWARPLPAPLRAAIFPIPKAVELYFRVVDKVNISPEADIGPGFCLIHARNVMIGNSKIGKNVLIFHEVTLGANSHSRACPELGDNVDVYVGARLLGDIKIGDNAKVGANCVVTSSVPAGATVVPAPNRVISAAAVAAFGPRAPRTGHAAAAAPAASGAPDTAASAPGKPSPSESVAPPSSEPGAGHVPPTVG